MNTYYMTKTEFLEDCDNVRQYYEFDSGNEVKKIDPNKKEEPVAIKGMKEFLEGMGIEVKCGEIKSWIASFLYLRDVVCDLNKNVEIAMECIEEWTRKPLQDLPYRIDVMIGGYNLQNQKVIILLEMKQWSNDLGHKDYFNIRFGKGNNPANQIKEYYEYLKKNNESVQNGSVRIIPLVCCYNLDKSTIGERVEKLENQIFDQTKTIPVFYNDGKTDLKHTLEDILNCDNDQRIFSVFRNGMPGVRSTFWDTVSQIFSNTDPSRYVSTFRVDQKKVYDTIKEEIDKFFTGTWTAGEKKDIIIEGGSGSGKSIVALELFLYGLNKINAEGNQNVRVKYITPQNATIDTYRNVNDGLTPSRKDVDDNMSQIGAVTNKPPYVDILIVDEIHYCFLDVSRYYDYSLLLGFRDINQEVSEKHHYNKTDIEVNHYLVSQFRCNCEEGYLSFIDGVLNNRASLVSDARNLDFDIRVIRDSNNFVELIKNHSKQFMVLAKDDIGNIQGMDSYKRLIEKGSFLYVHNNTPGKCYSSYNWIRGLEGDRIIVYINDDLEFNDGQIKASEEIIKQYYVLLTRGLISCYIFCKNEELRNFLHDEKKIPWYYSDSYVHDLVR